MFTLRSAIAHKAPNRDVFLSRVARTRQVEFFNSIFRLCNGDLEWKHSAFTFP